MISRLYIDEAVRHHPTVGTVQESFPGVPTSIVPDAAKVHEDLAAMRDPVGAGKRVLFLTRNKGSFLKKCPGTRSYICCGYQILHIGTYCTMDCAYCVLQTYFHPPVLQYFVNQERLFEELDDIARSERPPFHRIGTGEFTDSLIWEPWTQLSKTLIPYFAQQDRIVLELKTKSTAIENLRNLEHNKKTIVAWSLNAPSMIRREERGTASTRARLRAAAQCEAWGYPLAFHFDPLILYEGCEKDYRRLVRRLFSSVSPQSIAWISLGSFRFMPSLKPIIQKRFKKSRIVYGEFVPGLDGKMRYFKPLRIELYRKMAAWIRELAPDVTLYFCMEDEEVWKRALGFVPEDRGGVARMLDESAARHCGLKIEE
ncbi:MAG: DNA photolyase [Deltaproteobacteria bacterium]|nr:DNA photolyase [Deltaproteobacteria bacterium]